LPGAVSATLGFEGGGADPPKTEVRRKETTNFAAKPGGDLHM
jgi:hypothetical protein